MTILGAESTFSNVWSNLVSVGAPAAGLGTSVYVSAANFSYLSLAAGTSPSNAIDWPLFFAFRSGAVLAGASGLLFAADYGLIRMSTTWFASSF